jgi:amino acid adenylation domain-containing protein
MSVISSISLHLDHQEALQAKCYHPQGTFLEFAKQALERSVADRFEEQAAHYPSHLAVKSKNTSVTFADLNRSANRIAHAIVAVSAERGHPIALLIDNDVDVIAAILAVFKTGDICVPLDPGFHGARASYILEDTQARIILTNSKNLAAARGLAGDIRQVINIDEIGGRNSDANPNITVSPRAFAYVLYTSGSTGEPKGVIHSHESLLHDIMRYTNAFHICPEDRGAVFSSSAGGQGMKSILVSLLNGAMVCIWDVKTLGFIKLAEWLNAEGTTLYMSPPTLFRNFMKTLGSEERFPSVRLVRLGSESLHPADVDFYKKYFPPHCVFVVAYGATETGVATHHYIDRNSEITTTVLPVGHAADDIEIFLRGNSDLETRPQEIAIKSRYLSPGYWRRPDLTEAKFLPDPDGGEKRIYLTGDLGQILPDGDLMYIGREDLQVKIRGYRIEVGEIEALLAAQEAVREAVVTKFEFRGEPDEISDERLIAYIVPSGTARPTVSSLQDSIRQKLPDYMVPSAFVFLEALPLALNGKVDRMTLPPPGKARPAIATAYVAPRSPIEEQLARIWEKILSVESVGVHDNFFDVGGHSLAATRIVSEVIKQFGVQVPLQFLFESPTIAAMAAVVTENFSNTIGHDVLERIVSELESLSEEGAEKLIKTRLS